RPSRASRPTQVSPHRHRGLPAVLPLPPLPPPPVPPPPLPLGPPPMSLTPAAPLVADPWAAPPRQFLLGGRGGRLAVDLDDQHVAVVGGHGAVAEVDVRGSRQPQDPLLDRRGRRRGPQEHPP